MSKSGEVRKRNLAHFRIEDGKTVLQKVAELKNDPEVEYVQPNFIYYPQAVNYADDTNFGNLWGLNNTGQTVNGDSGTDDADIDAPEAWAVSDGTNDEVIVAVQDTGVDYNHPDLAANMWIGTDCVDENGGALGGCVHGYDFLYDDKDPLPGSMDDDYHGTHVAGTIAAVDNTQGVVGVAPNAKIMALRIGDTLGFSTIDAARSIAFAEANGAKIVNASWGGDRTDCSSAMDQALYDAISGFDGLFVVAAGNDASEHNNSTFFSFPADYGETTACWQGLDNIISVAATTNDDGLASYSDYGQGFVDVGAPGSTIYSTDSDVSVSQLLKEDFDALTAPDLPSGFTGTEDWGTFSFGTLGNVLYGDINSAPYPYREGVDSSFTSPGYDLSSAAAASIRFDIFCDTEYLAHDQSADWSDTDHMALEFSGDDGSSYSTFRKINEKSIDEAYGDTDDSDGSGIIEGFNVPAEYLTSSFRFRFNWHTDSDGDTGTNGWGCYIDNLAVEGYTSNPTGNAYVFSGGTSMAAPHVSGLAALAWGYKPIATESQIKTAVVDHGETISALDGKTISGMRINARNALDYLTEILAPHLEVTGSDTQVAGSSQVITVTAKNSDGSVDTTYSGDHAITFSGLSPASDGTHPKCSDKSAVDVEFESPTTLTFTSGVATCNLKAYKSETKSIDADDGTYSSGADPAYDLDLAVLPGAVSAADSSISVTPDPGAVGATESITVTTKDEYGNSLTSGSDSVSVSVTGSNPASLEASNNNDGTYSASYEPAVIGADAVSGTIDSQDIGQDTDGTSDGIFHLTINEGLPHFEVTSAVAGGTAGEEIAINVTARLQNGSVATSYDGEHNVIFSGAGESPNSYVPVATDNATSDYVDFGEETVLDFTDGVAETKIVLYEAAESSIDVVAGSVSSEDDEDYDLDLDITPSITNPYQTVIDVSPDPGVKGETVTVMVTVRDVYGNQVEVGGDDVSLEVEGANSHSLTVQDNNDGTYDAEYVPSNTGEDRISGMINGDDIIRDDDGDSDGTYHLNIQNVSGGGSGDFSELEVKFDKDDVEKGKTSKDKVEIKFSETDNISEYKISSDKDFSNNDWKGMKSKIKVKIKTDDGKKQKFYLIFKDKDGNVSETYTLKVEYQQQRKIRDFKKTIKRGETLHQTGKRFKKNSEVKLYFSRPDGSYYAPVVVKTDKKGSFALDYVVRKPKGTYYWYAVDSNGRKSNKASYKVTD